MTDRDRLIELLEDTLKEWECDVQSKTLSQIAEHLIENGVIVPPVKFGDTIFVIPSKANYELNIMHNMKKNNRVYEQIIDHIIIWQSDYMLYTCDGLCAVRSKAYKDTWFLIKEEAEQALAERSNNNAR